MSSAPAPRQFDGKVRPRKVDLTKLFEKEPPHALEAEAALLGSMILDEQAIGDVVQLLKGAGDFYKTAHAVIYEVLVDLYDRNQPITMVQLNQRLRDRGELEQVGGIDYLLQLAEAVPSATLATHFASMVREKSVLRSLIEATTGILDRAYNAPEDVGDLLDEAEQAIFSLAEGDATGEASDLRALLDETYARLEQHDGRLITGLETGFYELDEMTSGLHPGEMTIIAARPSMGKAQPLDASVLTPVGWRQMCELQVGDAVASIDGQPSMVTGVFPQGERQVYRMTFADGRSAECCAEHLWRVHFRGWDEPRIVDTEKLMTMLGRQRYQNRLWIDLFTGEFGDDDDLPLDPWLLGSLIGDGTLSGSSVRFSTADDEMLASMREVVGSEMLVNAAGKWDYRLTQREGAHRKGVAGVQPNPVKAALQTLGLWGCDATTKFIPDCYKHASRNARVRLLSGLLDTDGWVEKWGSLRFATSSETLAQDVVDLVRSIGGTASYRPKNTTYTYQGQKLEGRVSYVCNLQHHDAASLVGVTHKRERLLSGRQRQRRLNIVSIEPTRVTHTQCIAVSHPSRLYVTDNYVVTHNTAFALNIAEHVAASNHVPVAFFSLEMGKQQLAQRLLCSRSGVDSQRLRRNMIRDDDWRSLQDAMAELHDAPLYIDDTPGLSILALRAKARRLATRHHIKAIFVDYMQLMSGAKSDSREQEVSSISRGVKALARELEVPVICLSQLNRGPESREGHKPRMSDLRESGSIEQDADVVMMLHREDYYHRGDMDYADTGISELIIAKQRNGPTGTIPLQFNSATTRFLNAVGSTRTE